MRYNTTSFNSSRIQRPVRIFATPIGRLGKALSLGFVLLGFLIPSFAVGQTQDLTVDVLVNSSNPTYYDADPNNPGEYQRYPERYLENLQMPYRVIDVSTTAPPDMTGVQLIVAGHKMLQLSTAWQQAIITAVASGVGFVNLDNDPAIGTYSHIQAIFGATGSTQGGESTEIIVPAAMQPGGTTPHYIAGMQVHFPSDPPGDLIYSFHGDGISSYPTATATDLTGATGTVVATMFDTGHSITDPLILATTYGKGSAVYIGSYDYLRADRFGFSLGIDDLFWRSLVWAARKPFVMRAYPRFWALQFDDNDGIDNTFATRIQHFWDTSLTGSQLPDGTGGPWKVDAYIDADILDGNPGSDPGPNADRDLMIQDIGTGFLKASPHRNTAAYAGDLYWNGITGQWSDANWLTELQAALTAQVGNGGADSIPYSRSMVPEFFDLGTNTGYDMWHSLGQRYVLTIQQPGAEYYSSTPKTPAQRMPFHPFRIYEQPPAFGDQDETLPFFYADYYPVGSRAGLPTMNFFAFGSQILTDNFRFPGPDVKFPDYAGANSYSVASSVENFETNTWRFWTGLEPVTIFSHDQNNYSNSSDSERVQLVQQLSTWLNANGVIHTFVENIGDYLVARRTSTLTTASATNSTITLNFTGQATDLDGNLVPTQALVFYGNNNGTWVDVPGFGAGGSTVSFPNSTPPAISLSAATLNFAAVPGANPASQQVNITNSGGGMLSWFASSNASWLSVTPGSGTNAGPITASILSSGLAAGTYSTTIAISALGATNSPQYVNVNLVVGPTAITASPTTVTFQAYQNQGNPPPQTVTVGNSGGGQLTWTATPTVSWISVTPATGSAPGTFSVSANAAGLGIGTFFGGVTITSPQAHNSPVTIPVVLDVIGVLLGDNFASGTLDGWAYSPLGLAANWSVSNGAVQYNGGGHTQIYAGDDAWTDYTVSASIKLASLANYPGGIRGRVNPVTGSSYAVWLYPNSSTINLYLTNTWNIDSGNTLLGTAALAYDAAAYHTVSLAMQGSQLSVLYDGKQLISATDPTNASGMIALDVSDQPISFTNVNVTGTAASPGAFQPTPATLNFSGVAGGSNPAAQSIQLTNTGTGDVAWSSTSSAPWLLVSPTTGATPATLQVAANTTGLTPATYNGTINLVSLGADNSPQPINVQLTVTSPIPTLTVLPASLTFNTAFNGSNPAAQNITIASSAAASWTASSDSPWLTVSSSGGATPATLEVTVNTGGLPAGSYTGNVTIASPGLVGSPAVIPVAFNVYSVYSIDNFIGGLSGWAYSPLGNASGWSIIALSNGESAAQYNGEGATQLYAGNLAWADYSVQADVQLSSLNNYPGGIRGRVQTNGAGYAVWLYPGSQQVVLYRVSQWDINQGFVSLGTAPLVFDTNIHNLQLSMQGSQLTVLYDGQQIITATDSTYTNGLIALDVSSQPIAFGNVTVASTDAIATTFTPAQTSLTFNDTTASGPTSQSEQIGVAAGSVAYSVTSNASWLSATPAYGIAPATLQVTADPTGLAPGTYNGIITLASFGVSNSPQTIGVQLNITSATPMLSVSQSTLSFSAGVNGAVSAAQPLTISSNLPGSWSASSDSSWLTISAASGSTPATLQVTANPTGLAAGTYSGNLTITAPGFVGSPAVVPVTFTVDAAYDVDNFANGLAGWAYSPLGNASGWSAVTLPNGEGAAQYNGQGEAQIYAGSTSWTDYSVQADIQLSNLNNFPGGIRGRVQPTGGGYAVWFYPATQQIVLYSVGQWDINQGYTTLGTATQVFDTSKPHTIQLSMLGGQINVLYDGQMVISVTDGTYSSGMVALDGSSQPIAFGNVAVASMVPMSNTFAPSPAPLSFSYTTGATMPGSQTVSLTPNTGSVAYSSTSSATWLTLSPATGTAPASLTVTANPTGLAPATYNGSITLYSLGAINSPQTINAQLIVSAPPPILALSQSAMSFGAQVGGASPPSQSLTVTSSSTTQASWTATSDSAWLTVPTTSETTPATIQVTVNQTGLSAGTYNGNITITAPGAIGSPATIPVSFTVDGVYDTDNFSTGLAGWAYSTLGIPSNWSPTTFANGEGAVQYNGQGAAQIYAGTTAWADYSVQADVQLTNLNNFPGGIRGRVRPNGAGYAVWLYPGSQQVVLALVNQWDMTQGSTILGTAPLTFDTTQTVQLSMQGSQITVSIAGQQIISVTDSTYSSGMIALEGSTQPIAFGNVTVASLNGIPGTLSPSTSSLTLTAMMGSTAVSQSVPFTAGPGTLAYSTASSASWLTVSPTTGTVPGTLQVTANPTGLSVGTYNGTINLYSLGATNSPQTVGVQFTVNPAPAILNVSTTQMSFSAIANGASPATQALAVTSTNTTQTSFTASSDSAWLSVPATSQTTPSTIQVAANQTGLAAGTYTGHVTITAPGATGSPTTVTVTFTVSPQPSLSLSAITMSFAATLKGTAPAAQNLTVSSSTTTQTNFTASSDSTWLTVPTTSQTTPATIQVAVNPSASGLTTGTHTGHITITAPGAVGSPATVTVTFTVSPPLPTLSLSTTTMSFASTIGGTTPAAQTLTVSSSTTTQTSFAASSDSSWLTVPTASRTTPSSISVAVSMTGLAAGTYTGHVTITAPGAVGSPAKVTVTYTVSPQPSLKLSATTMSFTGISKGTAPATQGLTVSSSTATQTSFTASSDSTWLTVPTTSQTTPATIQVAVNPASLASGTYTGHVTITAPGALGSPAKLTVTFTVSPQPSLSLSATTMSFTAISNGTAPATQSLKVSSGTATQASFTASSDSTWLTVPTTSQTTPTTISVAVSPSGLAAGTHTGHITITAPGAAGSPATVTVTFTISPQASLSLSATTMSFSATLNGSAPASQSLKVSSGTPTQTSFTASSDSSWLTVPTTSQTTPATISVAVNPRGLAFGTHTGHVTITAPGASGSPATVTVTFVIRL